MKIFLECPATRTGGPESIHQFCNALNEMGYESYIFYYDKILDNVVYPEYIHTRIAPFIEDLPENILIMPEILRAPSNIKNMKVCVYWLSYDNASEEAKKANENLIHLYQSHYAKEKVNKEGFMIGDYINDNFNYDEDIQKEDIVCYNGTKDFVTQEICDSLGIKCIKIEKMRKREVHNVFKRCKIYVDNGNHPGKDRMPREAALLGCVVITNRKGSASNDIDIPIEEKCSNDDECKKLIKKVFSNYEFYLEKQKSYKNSIKIEKNIMKQNIIAFLNCIK